MVVIKRDYRRHPTNTKSILNVHQCSTMMHLDPKGHRWNIQKTAVHGKCSVNVRGLRLLCRGRQGFQISLQGKPGRPINAFKCNLHLCPKLFTSTNKRSLLQAPIRTNTLQCFYSGGIIFHLCRAPGKAGQRAG